MSLLLAVTVIALCILLQAFFEGSEMSLISCNRLRIHHLAHKGSKRAKMVQALLLRPENFLATTLVGSDLAVIIASSVASFIAMSYLEGYKALFSILVMWPVVLIFGEILPMTIFRQYATMAAPWAVIPLKVFRVILFPLVFIASLAARAVIFLLRGSQVSARAFASRQELLMLFEAKKKEGILEEKKQQMIFDIFDFGETTVQSIMVPLIDVVALPSKATVKEAKKLMASAGLSRISVYQERIDDIVGIIDVFDLLGASEGERVENLMEKPFIVPENKSIEALLKEFQINQKYMGIAVDEYGGVSGVVSLMDILEEIVGEIKGEYETEKQAPFQAFEDFWLVEGKMRLHDLNETFSLNLPEEEYETLGGFLSGLLGRIPSQGQTIIFGDMEFEILEGTDRKVTKVKMKRLSKPSF